MANVFIVAGGNFDKEFALSFINENSNGNPYVIACDSGFEHCSSIGILPQITVGDFDSISEEAFSKMEASGSQIIKLNPIKDDTDAEAALDIAVKRTSKEDAIYILGATGTRIDHILGNISLLGYGLKRDRTVYIVDSHNRVQMIESGQTLELSKSGQYGKFISIFPYGRVADGVEMKGFKYPLNRAILEGFNTLTVSNEITEEIAYISLKKGYLIVCESRD